MPAVFALFIITLTVICAPARAQIISEFEFNRAIDVVRQTYTPILAAQGKKLKIMNDWNLDEINSYAQRPYSTLDVVIHGGMGRVGGMTADGLSLITCHEIGHHLGGSPKKKIPVTKRWSSAEGQADYFAALKCLRKVFALDNNVALLQTHTVPALVDSQCKQVWKTQADYALCVRISMAGKSAALSLAYLGDEREPQFDTPDVREVAETFHERTGAQCALDTFFQAALCTVSADEDFSDTDEVMGSCHPARGTSLGNRPLCWFEPKRI